MHETILPDALWPLPTAGPEGLIQKELHVQLSSNSLPTD